MKAKHARQIREGILVARMSAAERAVTMMRSPLSKLSFRAYLREDERVLDRIMGFRMWESR